MMKVRLCIALMLISGLPIGCGSESAVQVPDKPAPRPKDPPTYTGSTVSPGEYEGRLRDDPT